MKGGRWKWESRKSKEKMNERGKSKNEMSERIGKEREKREEKNEAWEMEVRKKGNQMG